MWLCDEFPLESYVLLTHVFKGCFTGTKQNTRERKPLHLGWPHMSVMVSQITRNSIVLYTAFSCWQHRCQQCGKRFHAITSHDDVSKWKHFPRYWPFVRGIQQSPVNSPHKGQWRGALIISLICVWISGWVNNREAGGLRRYRAHYDVIVMILQGGEIVFICAGFNQQDPRCFMWEFRLEFL